MLGARQPLPPMGPAPGSGRGGRPAASSDVLLPGSIDHAAHATGPVDGTQLRTAETAGAAERLALAPVSPRPRVLDDEDADAWAWFCDLDKDGSGSLDVEEMWPLVKRVGLKLSRRAFEKRFDQLDPLGRGSVGFKAFAQWWKMMKETERRELRRSVKDAFEAVDSDRSGRLTKQEFGKMAHKARKFLRLDPPFDLETDWASCRVQSFGDMEPQLTYPDFEAWWKARLGIEEPDIPVLPEFMVSQVEEETRLLKKRHRRDTKHQIASSLSSSLSTPRSKRGEPRTGPELWALLRPRVLSIVRMQRQWGQLHDIYESSTSSRFDVAPLPKYIRDPDSNFSAFWDLLQVALLFYVSIIVPLRACFKIDTKLWSFAFIFDACVDIYFISDLCINFRTAYYRRDGTREERAPRITMHYLSGWFAVDFFSCLPVSYIEYFVTASEVAAYSVNGTLVSGGGEGNAGSNFKGVKMLRLVRLSKMLRLARLQKILAKYGGNVNMQTYVSVGFTVFTIFFLVHLMTCFFYLIGTNGMTIQANDNQVMGWVEIEESPGGHWYPDADEIPLSTRYVFSTSRVLNALENCDTDAERWFSVLSEFVGDLMLGMVAGLMTTISMALNGGEQEAQWRLRSLKGWMQKKGVPKTFQLKISEYCNELWSGKGFDTDELFKEVPPAMRLHLTSFLYGGTVANVPLFRGLSEEVIGALCNSCHPMYVMPDQEVTQEGQPGREMYIVLSGELEVTKGRGAKIRRLGFLSDGSFFGEASVLSEARAMEMRTRTVKAVTDSELCFLTRGDIQELCKEYNELAARLKRFENVGQMRMTKKKTTKLFGKEGGSLLRSYSEDYRAVRTVVNEHLQRSVEEDPSSAPGGQNRWQMETVREDRGNAAKMSPQSAVTRQILDSDDEDLDESAEAARLPTMGEIKAALRMKTMAANARARIASRRPHASGSASAAATAADAADGGNDSDDGGGKGALVPSPAEPSSAPSSTHVVAHSPSENYSGAQQTQIDRLSDRVELFETKIEGKLDGLEVILEKLLHQHV